MPDLYLVEFKGNRKEYCYNTFYHSLKLHDYVIVQAERGEDMGLLDRKVITGVDFSDMEKPHSILRPASEEDRRKLTQNRADEEMGWDKVLVFIKKYNLDMKLVDIEYQFDRNKLTFYFTAEHRVDFRALVRDLAAEYKTRIELRQIGVRDEAKRIDGFGLCGLQQCCSAFLKNFDPISTGEARIQGLSLNPAKISGNCGRLLCCLKYESEFYTEVRSKYPEIGEKYVTPNGEGIVDRINVFEDYMVVKLESGEEAKIYGRDIKKKDRKLTSFFFKCQKAFKLDKKE
ncbi:MAG: regulatory iron-sulfur-containing complex subunit RicT [candidate division Zixibacteria bacterium]|nr:regulatory iron-sulfur-containing complex subunit RicT [candidate division Zixibacteria bacterium]